MRNVLLAYRFFVFGIFIVCNAIIASVAVWNLSISQPAGQNDQVDQFMIFLGAFGLALVFPLIFIEVSRKDAITSHVWFECIWVGLFWVMELGGAAALSAIVPSGQLCNPPVSDSVSASDTESAKTGCTSSRVLLAFAWICTLILMSYLVILVVCTITLQSREPDVWKKSVRDVDWCKARQSLGSAPNSPTLPRFSRKTPDLIIAPQPRRPPPEISPATGLSPEYGIEFFQPPRLDPKPLPNDVFVSYALQRPAPAVPPVLEPLRPVRNENAAPPPSLYPQHLQSYLPSPSTRPLPDTRSPQKSPPASPPPLRDWPRRDPFQQPKVDRSARKLPPVVTNAAPRDLAPQRGSPQGNSPPQDSPPQGGSPDSTDSAAPAPQSTMPNTFSSRSRPGGPRKRSNSSGEWKRPPPLDLSKISSYRDKGKSGN